MACVNHTRPLLSLLHVETPVSIQHSPVNTTLSCQHSRSNGRGRTNGGIRDTKNPGFDQHPTILPRKSVGMVFRNKNWWIGQCVGYGQGSGGGGRVWSWSFLLWPFVSHYFTLCCLLFCFFFFCFFFSIALPQPQQSLQNSCCNCGGH